MRILHLGTDSHFAEYLTSAFERAAPGANELVQVSRTEPAARTDGFTGPKRWVPVTADSVPAVVEATSGADVVVVHAMSDFAALVCAQLPATTVLVWSGFGFDYYRGRSGADLYGERTLQLIAQQYRGRVPDPYGRLTGEDEPTSLDTLAVETVRRQVAARTDYFSAPAPADLEVFRRAYPSFAGTYRQLNYGDLTSMARTGDAVAHGPDLLVGNSAAWTNNHREAFVRIGKDIGSRRMIVPLTYGDPRYRDAVIRVGTKIYGERFVPIVEHLPIDDYLALVAGCSSTVLMHRRQQGVGNIVAALQQGTHVYLDRRNPLFGWLTAEGLSIRPVGLLKRDGIPDRPADAEEIAANREVLRRLWGVETVERNVASFVAELEERVSASAQPGRPRRGLLRRRSR